MPIGKEVVRKTKVENPFTLGVLNPKWRDVYLEGPHRPIKERLEGLAASPEGGIALILGQHGLGKTTLLYEFWDTMKEKGSIRIHTSCISMERENAWGKEEYLGSLARIVEALISIQSDKKVPLEKDLPKIGPISSEEFQEFIKDALSKTKGKLVIVFDDADVFGENLPEKDEKLFPELNKILSELAKAVKATGEDGNGLSIVFAAGEGVGSEWQKDLKSIAPETDTLRARLFTKEEVNQLVSQDVGGKPLKWTKKAIDYLYKQTGGNPAFVQGVANRVAKPFCYDDISALDSLNVTEEDVKKAVLKLSNLLQGKLQLYYIKWGISPEGVKLLSQLKEQKLIDKESFDIDTSKLDQDDEDVLNILVEQEVLSKDEEGYKLRVGMYLAPLTLQP